MRKALFVACTGALFFIVAGCMTVPPKGAIAGAAKPQLIGPESGYTGVGPADAHDWDDDDARLALWLRRNLPDRFAEIPFPLVKLFSYNNHYDRDQYMAIFEWEYYFADMNDPRLMVRMNTLEARDRNETRRKELAEREAAEKAAAEKAVTGDVSKMSDREVSDELQTVYP
jgi:hypothetical protein